MADLISGRYGQLAPAYALIGDQNNATQTYIPARSTFEWQTMGQLGDNAAAASGAFLYAAVPCDAGVLISTVTIWVGNTAASTPTHHAAAIYSGLASSPALLAKSADQTTTAVPAGAAFSYSLTSPYFVKASDVVNGYLYAGFTMTATAVCTVAGASAAQVANVNIQYSTNQPFLAGTSGSALAGVPASTLTLAASTLHQPVVILT
jgi:hypothetical protein